jgi:pimeloyl-ACP methyl ester carboxylesterase
MPTIDLRGAKIAYADTGAGETVLLLHSSACSGSQWQALAGRLQTTFRVLVPDLYGYGDTDPWPGDAPLTLADEAKLAEAVLGRCYGRIHVIGHSYGGAVGLRLAVEQPERLMSLTLIEPVAFHMLRCEDPADHDLFREIAALAAWVADTAARGNPRGGMARFVDYWNGAGAWLRMKPELQAALARRTAKVAQDFAATMADVTPIDALRRIAVPTLIQRGSASPLPARRVAQLLADALPNARLATLEGAGHMLPLTHGEAVNAAILQHLVRNTAGRRPAAAA